MNANELLGDAFVNMISDLSRKHQPNENAGNDEGHHSEGIKNERAPVIGKPTLHYDPNHPHGMAETTPQAKRNQNEERPPSPALTRLHRERDDPQQKKLKNTRGKRSAPPDVTAKR
ncbi:MAG: hypothetical protein J0M24_19595 [Verrucomicrobia bacterium]|nr:hypothetical protein [Verrucomicrobiota bacterium]